MTLTIRDISEARRDDIEALDSLSTIAYRVLVAVAEQLECFERRYRGTIDDDGTRYLAVLQVWEAAYEAAGGVVQR